MVGFRQFESREAFVKRYLIVVAAFALLFTACGGSEESADVGDDSDVVAAENGSDGGSDAGGDGGSDAGGEGGDDPGEGRDDDDFAEIVGNEDLSLEDLPDDIADMADDIDDIVSLGDCVAVGLMATAPEGWMYRVVDNPTPIFDGFTMFMEGNALNITIGTPSPIGSPCEILQMCDTATPIDISDNFPDAMIVDIFGTISIWGTHATGAEMVVTKATALTDEEMQLVMDVLDSVGPA